MLVLSRLRYEKVMIGDDIEVIVVDIRGPKVRLGFSAPNETPIHRREVYDDIRRNRPAVPPINLRWFNLGATLRSPHPVFVDGDVPLCYIVLDNGMEWTAEFEGTLLHTGTLPECLDACLQDARKCVNDARRESA